MKQKIIIGLVTLLAVFGIATSMSAPVLAVDVLEPVCTGANADAQASSICKDRANNNQNGGNPLVGPNGILTTYIRILSLVIGIGAVIMIAFSGFRFVTSQGDPQAVASARNGIIYAVVGLVVAALAQTIVIFVIGRL